jgi:hypothetical protein
MAAREHKNRRRSNSFIGRGATTSEDPSSFAEMLRFVSVLVFGASLDIGGWNLEFPGARYFTEPNCSG